MRLCTFAGCIRPHYGRGLCDTHYKQRRRGQNLTPIGDALFRDLEARITARSVPDGECVVWTGYRMPNGYGRISFGGQIWLVHRAVWTHRNGPIPDGLTIDHVCGVRACVNTDHMETVTRGENTRRALRARGYRVPVDGVERAG